MEEVVDKLTKDTSSTNAAASLLRHLCLADDRVEPINDLQAYSLHLISTPLDPLKHGVDR